MTEEEKTKVIALIQKLFALSENNPSENEAALAMARARNLLIKYNLSEDEVDAVESNNGPGGLEGGDSVVTLKTGRIHDWVMGLANVICVYFDVKFFYRRRVNTTLTFYGIKTNSEAAVYAFQSVFNQIQVLAKKFKPSVEDFEAQRYYTDFAIYSVKARFEYREGIISGLSARVAGMRKEEDKEFGKERITALAIRSEDVAKQWLATNKIKVKSETRYSHSYGTNSNGYSSGKQDSSKIHITGKGLKG